MPVCLIVCNCSYSFSLQLLFKQDIAWLHQRKLILTIAVFGCFTMKWVLWPNAPIIGGWAVLFTPRKYIFFKRKTLVFSLKIISFLPQLSNNLSFYVLFILNFHFLKLDPLLGLDAGTFQIFLCSLTRLQLYTKPYIWCILKTSQTYAPKLSLPPFRNVIQLKFSMRLKLIKSAITYIMYLNEI